MAQAAEAQVAQVEAVVPTASPPAKGMEAQVEAPEQEEEEGDRKELGEMPEAVAA